MRTRRFGMTLIVIAAALICGPRALAHPDNDWHAVRQVLVEFASAVADGDVAAAGALLQERTDDAPGYDRKRVLRMVRNSPGRRRVALRYSTSVLTPGY